MDPAFSISLFLAGALTLILFYEWRWRRPPVDQLSLYRQQLNQLRNEVADLRTRLRVAAARYTEEARAHAMTRDQAHAVQMKLLDTAGVREAPAGSVVDDSEWQELAGERDSLLAQRDALADELDQACQRLDKTERALDDTRLELAAAQRELAAMEVALAAIETESAAPDPAPLQAALNQAQVELVDVKAQLAAAQTDLAAAEAALGTAASAPAATAATDDAGAAEREQLRAAVADLQADLLEATALIGQFPILELEKQQLQTALAQSELDREQMSQRLTEAANYVQTLRRKYDFVLDKLRQQMSAAPSTNNDQGPQDDGAAAAADADPADNAAAVPDNFRQIHGIGPTYQRRLYEAGIQTFADLAALTTAQLLDITEARGLQAGTLEDWLAAAEKLAAARALR